MRVAKTRSVPIEMTADPRIARRVKRLIATAAIALGVIFGLAVGTLAVPGIVAAAFAGGSILMPVILAASLTWPRLRYALVVPVSFVTLGLVAVCVGWLPRDPIAAAGWLLVTSGVLFGGILGLWFWFRIVPVPPQFDDPYSPGRLMLIRVHVALVVVGVVLAALPR